MLPLHVHSWHSLLEATASPEILLKRAATLGYQALALTDTNNLYGTVAFTQLAMKHGIRPLIGACLRREPERCVALVADTAGYRNLCKILSRLHLSDAPLADLLLDNAAGLHLLVSDAGLAERLRDAYAGRLWWEVVRPARTDPAEQAFLAEGRRLELPFIASTATHLATPEDYHALRLITTIRQATLIDQLPGQLTIKPDHHLVDAATWRRRFHDLPEALRNVAWLAKHLRSDVLPRGAVLPPVQVPRGHETAGYLRLLCERGLVRRGMGDNPAAQERLREELVVIEAGGLAGYFLVVHGIARHARHKGYPMALRGSAGNSLVCYLLEITDVDPLRFNLPMERFLHPGRTDLPDIDLDFDWKVRDDIIAHVFERYGAAHTAMISSHLYLQPRSAFREAGKLHGLSNEQVSRLLETLSDRVEGLLHEAGEARLPSRFPLEAERWPRILADARLLLGRPHHLSIHPGGVVITPEPIEEYVPLERAAKGIVITQFEKDAAEHIGLVKIDLLGNRALATLHAANKGDAQKKGTGTFCAKHPSGRSGKRCPSPFSERPLYLGDTLGVNQLESPAMRHLLVQMAARNLDDVIQALAMIRPGAASVGMKECYIRRRRGLEPVRHLHPRLESVLGETQGLMLYEDDALRVMQVLTGLSAPEADYFRKRIAKHRTPEEAASLTQEFLSACARNGIERAVAGEIWVQLAKFNHYSFCKSHAVSYGLIAWEALGLKVQHPCRFWTAALNNNQGMYPRRVYIEAIKRAGIAVLLPCVNRSDDDFTVEDAAIRTGLSAIGSLPEELRLALFADRTRHGPYRDLADFRQRLHPGPEALALLIRCGAFDFTGQTRPALFLEESFSPEVRKGDGHRCAKHPSGRAGNGARPLFGPQRLFDDDPNPAWSPADYTRVQRLHDEWDVLGFVVGPPMMALFRHSVPPDVQTSRDLAGHIGKPIRLAGLVATARLTPMVDGRTMQFITLEDEWGQVDVTLFPGTCPPLPYLTLGPYLVRGVVEEQYDVLTVTAQSLQKVRTVRAERTDVPNLSSPGRGDAGKAVG
jgi:DNA-directed DNA polymerase III PolC